MRSSKDLGPVGAVAGSRWRSWLGLHADERPSAVVVEGTWWRAERAQRRLAHLEDVRELAMPDLFLGRTGDRWLLFACPYGAAHTAEVVHVAARVGAGLAIQLGSCGVVGAGVRPGDVLVPDEVLGLDGVTPLYAPHPLVESSTAWAERAADELRAMGVTVQHGPTVTWPTLFNQPIERAQGWRRDGYLGVDMETAATLAVARSFDLAGVAMLVAWDDVLSGRSFLDPLTDEEAGAFGEAEEAIFAVALKLIAGPR